MAERDIVLKNITDPQRMTDIYKNHEKRYLKEEKIREAKKADDYKRLHPQAGTHYFSILTPTFYTMGLSAKNPKLPSFTSDFGGISFGMAFDYFYKDDRFVTLELKHHLNTFDPFFFVGDYDQQADKMDFSIRKGHKINRFEFSYGLSVVYTQYTYTVSKEIDQITPYFSRDDDDIDIIDRSYTSLGFSTLFNYQFAPRFFIGLRYHPTIYSFRKNTNSFDYEHILGIDFRIKF